MRSPPPPASCAAGPSAVNGHCTQAARRGGDGRRRKRQLQHLHGSGHRLQPFSARCQARQQGDQLQVGLGRCPGGAENPDRSRQGWSGAVPQGEELRLSLCAEFPSCHESGGAREKADRQEDHLQPPGPAVQPGQPGLPADRRFLHDDHAHLHARHRDPRHTQRDARIEQGRPRRDQPVGTRPSAFTSRATRSRRFEFDPKAFGIRCGA